MPLVAYRGSATGARLIFGVSTREFLRVRNPMTTIEDSEPTAINKNPIYGSIIVIISIILITLFLLLAPDSVQPIASYIAFALLLLLPLVFVSVIFCKNFMKKYLSPQQIPDNERADEDCDESATENRCRSSTASTGTVQSPEEHKLSISSMPNTIYALMTSPGRKTPPPPAYCEVKRTSN